MKNTLSRQLCWKREGIKRRWFWLRPWHRLFEPRHFCKWGNKVACNCLWLSFNWNPNPKSLRWILQEEWRKLPSISVFRLYQAWNDTMNARQLHTSEGHLSHNWGWKRTETGKGFEWNVDFVRSRTSGACLLAYQSKFLSLFFTF